MNGALATAALAMTAGGVLTLLSAPVHGWRPAIRLALEFWTGAGLLNLSAAPGWPALGVAAAIIAIRQLVQLGRDRASAPRGLR